MCHQNFWTKVQQLIRICYYAENGGLFSDEFIELYSKDKFPLWGDLLCSPEKFSPTPLINDPLYNKNGTTHTDLQNNKDLLKPFSEIGFYNGIEGINNVLLKHKSNKKLNRNNFS